MTPPVLSARGLGVSYAGRPALRGVDLEVFQGQVLALIGPSGCGKTSLLWALNRMTELVPGCAVEGEVRLDGEEVHDPGVDLRRLRQRVGLIFQRPTPFPGTVRENLDIALAERGLEPGARPDEARRLLEEVGLWDEVADRLDAPAPGLSGGQQQRLCIARALAMQPEVLLMDEPCSALDPLATEVIEDLIQRLAGEYSLVVVTHALAQARRIASHAAMFWIEDGVGCLVEADEAEALFTDPKDPRTRAYVEGRAG